MAASEELSFVIPGFTPETIPLDRLIEYLQQMVILLGDPDQLHLISIDEGSVKPIIRATKTVVNNSKHNLKNIKSGIGTRKQNDAHKKIRGMLRRDAPGSNIQAHIYYKKQILLKISPEDEISKPISGIRQHTTIDGQLIRVGGVSEDASLSIQDLQGKTISGLFAKRAIAKDLGALLWEPVRLSGVGVWDRTIEGEWILNRMQVQSFEKLVDQELDVLVDNLVSLNLPWPENTMSLLTEERELSI